MASESIDVEGRAAAASAARDRMAGSIAALETKLDPRRLLNVAGAKAKASGEEIANRAGAGLKAHPIAIGAGIAAVAVAILAGRQIGGATLDLGDDLDGYTDYEEAMGEAPRFYDDEFLEDEPAPAPAALLATPASNPLMAILAGLAAGAVLGLLLPSSEAEKRLLRGDA
ncbi:hypothetical protein [Sandarakinorhabdus sp.]|uniref:hypothetical protein n=1 Tax=Sandarakinorhabdus sp. TaxID=1916663 RepID=UPI00286E05D1|nr:hypothetical protein [Sandarakinorhabdus sp.]